MADLNQSQHILIYGDVKITDLSRAVKVCHYPRDCIQLPKFGIGEKVAVAISKERMDADPHGCDALLREVDKQTNITGVGEKTIKNVAHRMGKNSLLNLSKLEGVPCATSLSAPLRGIPAFIVAAGPSLDKNIHLLQECAKYGVIITMNTPARAIRAVGAPIDALVTIESLESMTTIEQGYGDQGGYSVMGLDITSAPSSWDANADLRFTFVNDDPAFSSPIRALGGASLPFGGCVATAAVSLARYWGAQAIYLLGQDCAWTDGRGYAKNTNNEDLTCEVRGQFLVFHGKAGREGRALSYIQVPEWSNTGKMVYSTHDMVSFAQWFSEANKRRQPGTRGIVNCTEGGISISGVPSVPLEKVLDFEYRGLRHPSNPRDVFKKAFAEAPGPSWADIERVKDDMRRSAEAIIAAAKQWDKRPCVANYFAWRCAVERLPVLDALIASRCSRIRARVSMGFKKQFNAVARISAKGAREALKYLG